MKLKKRPKGLKDIGGSYRPEVVILPPLSPDQERLVSVAIATDDGVVHHGMKTHADLRGVINRKEGYIGRYEDVYVSNRRDREGYYTNKDRFVGRAEACEIGLESRQVRGGMRSNLLSCDVDW